MGQENSFQVDIRVNGVLHDVTHKEKKGVRKYRRLVDKLQNGYRTNSIINDLGKKGISNEFSEASRRTKKWATLSYTNVAKQSKKSSVSYVLRFFFGQGTVSCLCGKCLVSSSKQTNKIKNRLTSCPIFCTTRKEDIQENFMDQNSGNMTIGRQEIQHKDQRKDTMNPLNTDGSRILHTKNRNCRTVGLLSTANTPSTSRRSK